MKTRHTALMQDPEFRRLLSVEALVGEASEVIAGLMAEQNLSKADLARRLNKSRAWVTQLLSGKANMTVRTLAEVAYTLGAEVKLQARAPSWKMSGNAHKGPKRSPNAIRASSGASPRYRDGLENSSPTGGSQTV